MLIAKSKTVGRGTSYQQFNSGVTPSLCRLNWHNTRLPMGVFHTIAMFCTIDALSLNNSSKTATTFQLRTRVVGNLSSSTFELLCAISTTIFSQLSAESRNTSLLIAPKRTAYENRIPSSILARPEAFSHSKIPTHLFPRATPPLISRPTSRLSHRTFPTDLPRPTSLLPTPPLPTSPPPILPPPSSSSRLQPPSANLLSPCVGFRNRRHHSITQAVSLFEYRVITRPVQ